MPSDDSVRPGMIQKFLNRTFYLLHGEKPRVYRRRTGDVPKNVPKTVPRSVLKSVEPPRAYRWCTEKCTDNCTELGEFTESIPMLYRRLYRAMHHRPLVYRCHLVLWLFSKISKDSRDEVIERLPTVPWIVFLICIFARLANTAI